MNRGEIWWYRFSSPDKKRPVVILMRQEVIDLLHSVIVAPVTSTIRGIPSEVTVGISEGLKHGSVVNLDRVLTVERSRLSGYIGRLDGEKMRQVCRALARAVGCETTSAGSGLTAISNASGRE